MIESGGKLFGRMNTIWRRKRPGPVPVIPEQALCRFLNKRAPTYEDEESSEGPPAPNQQQYSSEKETHFGFETVSEAEKAKKVKSVFENVADRYDLMNDCMSAGVHRVWKDIFVHRINPGPKTRLLDVAGGTGDIAFRFMKFKQVTAADTKKTTISPVSKHSQSVAGNKPEPEAEPNSNTSNVHESRSVLISDINPRMLEVGMKRAETILTKDELQRVDWMEADAENLSQIPDNSFDVYTIAFGIRNCVHVDKVVQEAYRILKPGGRFMCLEFSHVPNSTIKWMYDQYSFQVIPAMGQVIAGDWDSYKYLVESIRKFPTQEDFKAIIQSAGFRFVNYENLTFGVAAIHSGYKI